MLLKWGILLTGSPWDSPTSLLRSPVAWVRAIFVEASTRPSSAHILQVQWFGEVEGVCSWQNICTYDGLFHTFTYGLTNCRHYLGYVIPNLPSSRPPSSVTLTGTSFTSSERASLNAVKCIIPPRLRKLPALILPFSFFWPSLQQMLATYRANCRMPLQKSQM